MHSSTDRILTQSYFILNNLQYLLIINLIKHYLIYFDSNTEVELILTINQENIHTTSALLASPHESRPWPKYFNNCDPRDDCPLWSGFWHNGAPIPLTVLPPFANQLWLCVALQSKPCIILNAKRNKSCDTLCREAIFLHAKIGMHRHHHHRVCVVAPKSNDIRQSSRRQQPGSTC